MTQADMAQQLLAAVRTAPGRTQVHEFRIREIPDDGALLKVEVADIRGPDVKMHAKPAIAAPVIMGHENVGVIATAGRRFVERHGVHVSLLPWKDGPR